MNGPNKNKTSRRGHSVAAFIFAAIVLRAIIPLGYMPGNALAGEYLVLCPQGVSQDFAAALHLGHAVDSREELDVTSACPIGQGLNHDALPTAIPELDKAAAGAGLAFDSPSAVFDPSFERRYASRAPPSI